ncbi:uncharacterized protein LOC130709926 [Lotus japonicus]|uniref:uncharacterized protein LOC130709926 n=1 Tax=Lotus japonicus TaxID=34305 RepID=UPI002584AF09|nr:uncharacterized protein LOC130709926 [Lotus japonicus]
MDGRYMVKTGYRFIQQAWEEDAVSSSMSTSLSTQQWKRFWSSSALPRCKEMAWRLVRGFLPVNMELKRRHLEVDEACVWCCRGSEILEHVFLHYTTAKSFWFGSTLALRTEQLSSLHDFWEAVLLDGDGDFIGLVQTLCYTLWEARNNCRFNHVIFSPSVALHRANMLLSTSQMYVQVQIPSHSNVQATWRRPIQGVFKVKFDASYGSGGITGYGVVARDYEGEVLASATTTCPIASLSPSGGSGLFSVGVMFGDRLGKMETSRLSWRRCWIPQLGLEEDGWTRRGGGSEGAEVKEEDLK